MKQLLTVYTFDPANNQIVCPGSNISIEQFLLCADVSNNTIIYAFDDPDLGGSVTYDAPSGNTTLHLNYPITAFDPADRIQIWIDVQNDIATDTKIYDIRSNQTNGNQLTKIPSIAISKKSVVVTASGDTTIHTPASGKKIRLYAFGYSASGTLDTGNAKIQWKFGTGAYKDTQFLTGNQGYGKSPGNGKFCYEGAVDEALIVTLDTTATIAVNIDYEEI